LEKKIIPLPHRWPFLFVDSFEVNGNSVEAHYHVDPNLPFFQGHFPDYPIFPGVLHVEAMAQALGLLVRTPGLPLLARVDHARFLQPIFPGDDITIKASLENEKAGFYFGSGQVFKGDSLVSEAKIVFKVAREND
jgi:3-hydroxyacyl-[acyl-carrier-protein] dehydratase